MATNMKTGGKNWKPGQSGNPKGRPSLPAELKEKMQDNRSRFDREIYREMVIDTLKANKEKLKSIIGDSEATALQIWLASATARGMATGDLSRLETLLIRTLGYVPRPVEMSGPQGAPLQIETADSAKRQELLVRILERSRLLDDPHVKDALKRRFLDEPSLPTED